MEQAQHPSLARYAEADPIAERDALRVFLVEDSPAIRVRIAAIVTGVPNVRLVGESDRVADAIDAITATRPDALVLDLQIIGGSGLDVLRSVRSSLPAMRIAVLTNFASDQYRRACFHAGAERFLDKSDEFALIPEVLAGWAMDKAGGAQRPAAITSRT